MDRVSLKGYAKQFLKDHLLEAWGVMFIMSLIGGRYDPISHGTRQGMRALREPELMFQLPEPFLLIAPSILFPLGLFIAALAVLFAIFVINNLRIGVKDYFIHALSDVDVTFERIVTPFKTGNWKRLGPKLFYLDVVIFLWTLLLIIPGVIKYYQYYWVPYLLAENPEMSIQDAMNQSAAMTEGEKVDLFGIDLSFIGWRLLASFIIPFITTPMVNAYVEATFGTYYLLKRDLGFEKYDEFYDESPL